MYLSLKYYLKCDRIKSGASIKIKFHTLSTEQNQFNGPLNHSVDEIKVLRLKAVVLYKSEYNSPLIFQSKGRAAGECSNTPVFYSHVSVTFPLICYLYDSCHVWGPAL